MTTPIAADIHHVTAQRSISRSTAAGAKRLDGPDDLRSPEATAKGDLEEHGAPKVPDFKGLTHPRPPVPDDGSDDPDRQARGDGANAVSASHTRTPYDPEPTVSRYLDIIA